MSIRKGKRERMALRAFYEKNGLPKRGSPVSTRKVYTPAILGMASAWKSINQGGGKNAKRVAKPIWGWSYRLHLSALKTSGRIIPT